MLAKLSISAGMAVALVAAPSAQGAPPRAPQLMDPRGDSIGGEPGTDVLSVLWRTTGRTDTVVERGRRKKKYVPRHLVVTMNLAGKPHGAPFAYEAAAQVEGCGRLQFRYAPGTVFASSAGDATVWHDCADVVDPLSDRRAIIANVEHQVTATSITWQVHISLLPGAIRPGVEVSAFRAYVDVAEPLLSYAGTRTADAGIDEGRADDVTWTFG